MVQAYKSDFLYCPRGLVISPVGQRTQLKWKMRNQKDKQGCCKSYVMQFCSRLDADRHGSTVSPWADRHHGLNRSRHTSKNKQLGGENISTQHRWRQAVDSANIGNTVIPHMREFSLWKQGIFLASSKNRCWKRKWQCAKTKK